jgi:hypothetical protein
VKHCASVHEISANRGDGSLETVVRENWEKLYLGTVELQNRRQRPYSLMLQVFMGHGEADILTWEPHLDFAGECSPDSYLL